MGSGDPVVRQLDVIPDGPRNIAEVSVQPDGRLCVRPELAPAETLEFIWRAACEVNWDPRLQALVTPVPDLTPNQLWFGQIISAVASEYGVPLRLTESTTWTNMSPELRAAIETCAGQFAA